jgi:hypothetical protein
MADAGVARNWHRRDNCQSGQNEDGCRRINHVGLDELLRDLELEAMEMPRLLTNLGTDGMHG